MRALHRPAQRHLVGHTIGQPSLYVDALRTPNCLLGMLAGNTPLHLCRTRFCLLRSGWRSRLNRAVAPGRDYREVS